MSTHSTRCLPLGSDANAARRYEGKPEDYAVRVDDQPPVRLQDLRLRLCSAAHTERRNVPSRRGMARHGTGWIRIAE